MRTALYRHWNADGELLYVGISLKPFQRLDQHKNNSHWYGDIANVSVEYFDTRSLAEDAERVAINKEKPLHNITHALVHGDLPQRRLERRAVRPSEKVLFAPRWMRREIAAYYIGISPTLFDRKRKEGAIPPPRAALGVYVWDKDELDALFVTDRENEAENYWDKVCGLIPEKPTITTTATRRRT